MRLTITGRIAGDAYFGDKDTPAEGATLELLRRLPSDREWQAVREFTVGPDGRFAFAAISPTIYSVYAELIPRPGVEDASRVGIIQSKPRSIAPGDDVTGVELDVRLRGYVRIRLSRDIPVPFAVDQHLTIRGRALRRVAGTGGMVGLGVAGRITCDERFIAQNRFDLDQLGRVTPSMAMMA